MLRESINNSSFRQFYKCASRTEFKSIYFPTNEILRVLGADVIILGIKDDQMWFVGVGALHRFGKQEFALMTELKVGATDINVNDLENESLEGDNIVSRLSMI